MARAAPGACVLLVAAAAALPRVAAWTWTLPKLSGDVPGARAGNAVTAVKIGSAQQVLTCGGSDQTGRATSAGCTLLDASSWTFRDVIPPMLTAPRVDATAFPYFSWVVLWGGQVLNATGVDPAACEVWTLGTWTRVTEPTCGGAVPAPRWGHSLVVAGSNAVVFGGATLSEPGVPSTDLNDIAVLSLGDGASPASFSWRTLPDPPPGPRPQPRHYHAATLWTGCGNDEGSVCMIVFGGCTFSATLGVGSATPGVGSDSSSKGLASTGSGLRQRASPLSSGVTALEDMWLLPLGGSAAFTAWTQLFPTGGLPLYGHRLFAVGSLLLAYGGQLPASGPGVIALDTSAARESWSWFSPSAAGARLDRAFRAGAAILDADSDGSPELVVLGGQDPALGVCTAGVALLNDIAVVLPSAPPNLALILGAAAGGLLLLLAVGVFAWRRRLTARARGGPGSGTDDERLPFARTGAAGGVPAGVGAGGSASARRAGGGPGGGAGSGSGSTPLPRVGSGGSGGSWDGRGSHDEGAAPWTRGGAATALEVEEEDEQEQMRF